MMLASCATMPIRSTGQAAHIGTAINHAKAVYDRTAASVEVILPFLTPERHARIRLAMALTERGLIAARTAVLLAEQMAALKQSRSCHGCYRHSGPGLIQAGICIRYAISAAS